MKLSPALNRQDDRQDTWTYEPAADYHGTDSFAITAQGQSIDEKPGTSVLSFTVNVK